MGERSIYLCFCEASHIGNLLVFREPMSPLTSGCRFIYKKRPAFLLVLRAVGLTIIETCHTTFVNFQTLYIGMNRCSTVSLGNGNVYEWIEINSSQIVTVGFRPFSRAERPQRALRWGYFYPSPPVFQKDNRCYPDFALRTPYSQRAYQQLCVKIFPENFRFSLSDLQCIH